MKFSPKNRYLLVETQKQEDADTGVLLPEGYTLRKDKYVTATVLDTAMTAKMPSHTAPKLWMMRQC